LLPTRLISLHLFACPAIDMPSTCVLATERAAANTIEALHVRALDMDGDVEDDRRATRPAAWDQRLILAGLCDSMRVGEVIRDVAPECAKRLVAVTPATVHHRRARVV
jgi:hypothetical protein